MIDTELGAVFPDQRLPSATLLELTQVTGVAAMLSSCAIPLDEFAVNNVLYLANVVSSQPLMHA